MTNNGTPTWHFPVPDDIPDADLPAAVERAVSLIHVLTLRLTNARLAVQATAKSPPRCMSVQDAADRSGLSRDFFYDHADALPFISRKGRRVLIDVAGFNRWLGRNGTGGAT